MHKPVPVSPVTPDAYVPALLPQLFGPMELNDEALRQVVGGLGPNDGWLTAGPNNGW